MKNYPNKFYMSSAENYQFANSNWQANVYCGMRMECREITFSQTQMILNGVNVPNVQLDDIQAVLNMRDAWKYLLNTVDAPVTPEYLCKLNEYIARNESLEWGTLRTGSVGISGTDYMPPVPTLDAVTEQLKNILSADTTATAKALEAFVWGARGQFFWDGNKRTSMTLANKILISAGVGFLTITDRHMEQFNGLLLDYYNTGISETLTDFLYENAISGIT